MPNTISTLYRHRSLLYACHTWIYWWWCNFKWMFCVCTRFHVRMSIWCEQICILAKLVSVPMLGSLWVCGHWSNICYWGENNRMVKYGIEMKVKGIAEDMGGQWINFICFGKQDFDLNRYILHIIRGYATIIPFNMAIQSKLEAIV